MAAAAPPDLLPALKALLRAQKIQLWEPPYSLPSGEGTIPADLVRRFAKVTEADPTHVAPLLEQLRVSTVRKHQKRMATQKQGSLDQSDLTPAASSESASESPSRGTPEVSSASVLSTQTSTEEPPEQQEEQEEQEEQQEQEQQQGLEVTESEQPAAGSAEAEAASASASTNEDAAVLRPPRRKKSSSELPVASAPAASAPATLSPPEQDEAATKPRSNSFYDPVMPEPVAGSTAQLQPQHQHQASSSSNEDLSRQEQYQQHLQQQQAQPQTAEAARKKRAFTDRFKKKTKEDLAAKMVSYENDAFFIAKTQEPANAGEPLYYDQMSKEEQAAYDAKIKAEKEQRLKEQAKPKKAADGQAKAKVKGEDGESSEDDDEDEDGDDLDAVPRRSTSSKPMGWKRTNSGLRLVLDDMPATEVDLTSNPDRQVSLSEESSTDPTPSIAQTGRTSSKLFHNPFKSKRKSSEQQSKRGRGSQVSEAAAAAALPIPEYHSDFNARDLKMTNEQRIEVMTLVREGKISVDEAVQQVLDTEQKIKQRPSVSSVDVGRVSEYPDKTPPSTPFNPFAPGGTVRAANMRMTDQDRIEIMKQVKENKISVEDAVAMVLQKEAELAYQAQLDEHMQAGKPAEEAPVFEPPTAEDHKAALATMFSDDDLAFMAGTLDQPRLRHMTLDRAQAAKKRPPTRTKFRESRADVQEHDDDDMFQSPLASERQSESDVSSSEAPPSAGTKQAPAATSSSKQEPAAAATAATTESDAEQPKQPPPRKKKSKKDLNAEGESANGERRGSMLKLPTFRKKSGTSPESSPKSPRFSPRFGRKKPPRPPPVGQAVQQAAPSKAAKLLGENPPVLASLDFKASDMHMSDEQRIIVMNLVKEGKMTVEEAVAKALQVEKQLSSEAEKQAAGPAVDEEGFVIVDESSKRPGAAPTNPFEEAFVKGTGGKRDPGNTDGGDGKAQAADGGDGDDDSSDGDDDDDGDAGVKRAPLSFRIASKPTAEVDVPASELKLDPNAKGSPFLLRREGTKDRSANAQQQEPADPFAPPRRKSKKGRSSTGSVSTDAGDEAQPQPQSEPPSESQSESQPVTQSEDKPLKEEKEQGAGDSDTSFDPRTEGVATAATMTAPDPFAPATGDGAQAAGGSSDSDPFSSAAVDPFAPAATGAQQTPGFSSDPFAPQTQTADNDEQAATKDKAGAQDHQQRQSEQGKPAAAAAAATSETPAISAPATQQKQQQQQQPQAEQPAKKPIKTPPVKAPRAAPRQPPAPSATSIAKQPEPTEETAEPTQPVTHSKIYQALNPQPLYKQETKVEATVLMASATGCIKDFSQLAQLVDSDMDDDDDQEFEEIEGESDEARLERMRAQAMAAAGQLMSNMSGATISTPQADEEEEDDDESETSELHIDDDFLAELDARRKQREEEERARAAELKAQYEAQTRAEHEARAAEVAELEAQKRRESESAEKQKESIFQEASSRLGSLTFSFTFNQ